MSFFISRFLRTLSIFFTFIILKLFSTNEELGEFSYWYIVLMFSGIFVKFNHQVFVLRFKHKINEYFSSFIFIQLLFLLVITVIYIYILPINIFFISLFFLIAFLFDSWESYFLIIKSPKLTNKIISFVSIVAILTKFLVYFNSKDNLSIKLLICSIIDLLSGFVLFFFFHKRKRKIIEINLKKIKEIFTYLFPFFINALLIYLTAKVDHFLIKKYFTFEQLGIYSFSYKLYEGIFIFQVIFNSILVSRFNEDLTSLNFSNMLSKFMKKWFSFTLLIMFLIGFVNFFIIDSIIDIGIFDTERTLFFILLPGVFFSFFGVIMSIIASIHGFSKEVLIINMLTLFISVSLNLILLKGSSIYIAAYISLFCQFLSSLVFWFMFKRTRSLIANSIICIFYFRYE